MHSLTDSSHDSQPRLKVFRIYERLPPKTGGMELHIQNLSFQQIKSGVCVVSVFNTGTPPPCSIRILNGIDICNIRPSYLRSFIFSPLSTCD